MSALHGQDIVCFSNDWAGDPLSKTHYMRLASKENRVLWVNSLGNRAPRLSTRDLRRMNRKLVELFEGEREVQKDLYVTSPLALPLPSQRWARAANARLVGAQLRRTMKRLRFRSPVVISFLPSAAPVVDRLDPLLTVYHCVDDFPAFEGAGSAIAELEKELCAKSDLMFCSSESLRRKKSALHPNPRMLAHGVDHAHFARALDPQLPVHELVRHLPSPRFVFMGLVAEWVDQALIPAVARHFPQGSVVVVGGRDVSCPLLEKEPNVHLIDRRPYTELPSMLKGMDAGLITFKDNAVSAGANPLKAREYIAAGLPVVSTPIPEVKRLGLCHIAKDEREFISCLEAVLATGSGPSELRSAAMRHESWEARWEEMGAKISEAIATRKVRRIA